MDRRAFILTALYSAAALLLLKVRGGQAAAVRDDDPGGLFPGSVPYTVASDPPKIYTFVPTVNR